MIELEFQELAVWAIGLAMAAVAVLVVRELRDRARAERRSLHGRVICRLCLAVFEASGREAVQTCPECGASTDRKGPRPLG